MAKLLLTLGGLKFGFVYPYLWLRSQVQKPDADKYFTIFFQKSLSVKEWVMLGFLATNIRFLMIHLHELIKHLMSWSPFLKGWLSRMSWERCVRTKEQCLQACLGLFSYCSWYAGFLNFSKIICMHKITVYCEMFAFHLVITHCLPLKCDMGFVHQGKLVSF